MAEGGGFDHGTQTPEYKLLRSKFDRLVSGIAPDIGKVARKAFAKDLISPERNDEAHNPRMPLDGRACLVLELILRKVQSDTRHYYKFVSILSEIPSLKSFADELDFPNGKKSGASSVDYSDSGLASQMSTLSVSGLPQQQQELEGVSSSSSVSDRVSTSSDLLNQIPRLDSHVNGITQEMVGTHQATGLQRARSELPSATLSAAIAGLKDESIPNKNDDEKYLQPNVAEVPSENLADQISESMNPKPLIPIAGPSTSGLTDSQINEDPSEVVLEKQQNLSPRSISLCPCGECSIEKYLGNECPKTSKERYPYLDMSGLDEAAQIEVRARLDSDLDKISKEFAELVTSTGLSLASQGISPDTVTMSVFSIASGDQTIVHKPLTEKQEEKLEKATSVPQVFNTLRHNWSFFHYEILEHIIKSLGSDQDKKKLDKYLIDLKDFCKRSVFEVPPHVYIYGRQAQGDLTGKKVFVVKVTERQNLILKDIQNTREKISKILKIPLTCLFLYRVDDGCVQLVFLIPSSIAEEVFPLSHETTTTLLENEISVISTANIEQHESMIVQLASRNSKHSKSDQHQHLGVPKIPSRRPNRERPVTAPPPQVQTTIQTRAAESITERSTIHRSKDELFHSRMEKKQHEAEENELERVKKQIEDVKKQLVDKYEQCKSQLVEKEQLVDAKNTVIASLKCEIQQYQETIEEYQCKIASTEKRNEDERKKYAIQIEELQQQLEENKSEYDMRVLELTEENYQLVERMHTDEERLRRKLAEAKEEVSALKLKLKEEELELSQAQIAKKDEELKLHKSESQAQIAKKDERIQQLERLLSQTSLSSQVSSGSTDSTFTPISEDKIN